MGEDIDDSYPFKSLNESVGILWDKNLSGEHYRLFIELQQENRQKLKNAYYLEKLNELGLLSSKQKDKLMQLSDILEMRIETIECDSFDEKMILKLKFFHFWFYYFVNNANYRFYKRLFRNNFSFSALFKPVISFL